MARIETYPLDYAITPNDFVLGSDGDNLNATRNYKVSTFLGYLGNLYGLSSQDMYFTYNPVASGSVGSGEISSNNYADVTRNMADITNLYISKLTELGALAEDFINAIATDGISIVLMDLGARENYAIIELTSSSDVDANTIDLVGTVSQSNGVLVTGRSIGIKIGAGGGSVDLSNYVTLDGTETISGSKTFSAANTSFSGFLTSVQRLNAATSVTTKLYIISPNSGANIPTIASSTGWVTVDTTSQGQAGYFFAQIGQGVSTGGVFSSQEGGFFDFDDLTAQRLYTWPDASGTIALTSDLSSYVTFSGVETITGQKTFTATSTKFDQYISLKEGGATGSVAGYASLSAQAGGTLRWVGAGEVESASLVMGGFAADRTFTFPDASGTIALTSDLSGYVDKTSTETVGGLKTFSSSIHAGNGQIIFNDDATPSGYASGGAMGYVGASQFYFHQDHANVNNTWGIFDFANLTAARTFTLPNASGTVALTSDIPTVSDVAYAASWNGNTDAPTKNAVYDKIESMPDANTPTSGSSGLTAIGLTSGTHTIGSQAWAWYQVGRLVFFTLEIVNCNGSTTGDFAIDYSGTSIPTMAVSPFGSQQFSCTAQALGTNFYSVKAFGQSGYIKLAIQTALDGTDATLSGASFGGSTSIYVSGCYVAANPI